MPPVRKGESVRTVALTNRAALHKANRRLEDDAAFYQDVQEQFSKPAVKDCGLFGWWCNE